MNFKTKKVDFGCLSMRFYGKNSPCGYYKNAFAICKIEFKIIDFINL